MNADGTFEAQGGRVEIRYKATDTRAYRAGAANLERDRRAPRSSRTTPSSQAKRSPSKRKSAGAAKADASEAAPRCGAVIPKDAWTVYADGACSGNPGPAGLGIYLKSPEGIEYNGSEYLGEGTNNVAELTAILRAAELVPLGAAAVLRTDSQYSIGVVQKGWKAKANQELVAKVKTALATRRERGASSTCPVTRGCR